MGEINNYPFTFNLLEIAKPVKFYAVTKLQKELATQGRGEDQNGIIFRNEHAMQPVFIVIIDIF